MVDGACGVCCGYGGRYQGEKEERVVVEPEVVSKFVVIVQLVDPSN
jgi:hypothetical protein